MIYQNEEELKLSESNRKTVLKIGGICALLTVVVAFCEMAVTFLPGGSSPVVAVVDWFTQLQTNRFMGLRNLGLLNIFMFTLGIPMYFALFLTHRKTYKTLAALALIISLVGVAAFLATNRAFAMLELSGQYALATTEAQRSLVAAAGQAMLSVGRSHSPGTFLGLFLGEVAGILMSVVMLRAKIFTKANAIIGIIGFSLLSIFEVWISFIPALHEVAMFVAMGGAIFNVLWMILLGRRLLQISRLEI
jgi:uncharacterized membrane protein